MHPCTHTYACVYTMHKQAGMHTHRITHMQACTLTHTHTQLHTAHMVTHRHRTDVHTHPHTCTPTPLPEMASRERELSSVRWAVLSYCCAHQRPKELGKQALPVLPGCRGWGLPHSTLGTLSSPGSFSRGLWPHLHWQAEAVLPGQACSAPRLGSALSPLTPAHPLPGLVLQRGHIRGGSQ